MLAFLAKTSRTMETIDASLNLALARSVGDSAHPCVICGSELEVSVTALPGWQNGYRARM